MQDCETAGFDQQAWATAISAAIQARGLQDREVARQAHVASSTISRCVRGPHSPDVSTLAKLVDWAGVPVEPFITRTQPFDGTLPDARRVLAAIQAAASAASTVAGGTA